MRFAIFVAVVAAHIVLLWLFPSLRRLVLLPIADEPAITPVYLPPLAEPMMELPLEQAAALTAHFKPLPGPRVRGPEFGWDYAATHRITRPEGGGLLIALNDRCAIFIFLLPMIGCSIGPGPPANGDLFKYMHKPVKFGDWDWRLDDP
jgi:hypothetical protein